MSCIDPQEPTETWNSNMRWTGPRVNATVDIVVENNFLLLLGRKPTDPPGKYRFIGGFSDPNDNSFAESAWRELNEETSNYWINDIKKQAPGFTDYTSLLLPIGSVKIPDPRLENTPDSIITTVFFLAWPEIDSPQIIASDDLEEVKWFEMEEAKKVLVPWHLPIIELLESE